MTPSVPTAITLKSIFVRPRAATFITLGSPFSFKSINTEFGALMRRKFVSPSVVVAIGEATGAGTTMGAATGAEATGAGITVGGKTGAEVAGPGVGAGTKIGATTGAGATGARVGAGTGATIGATTGAGSNGARVGMITGT
jgi:hypothetical protein